MDLPGPFFCAAPAAAAIVAAGAHWALGLLGHHALEVPALLRRPAENRARRTFLT
jgi:hypothetical protein